MDSDTHSSQLAGITYDDKLPVAWEILPELPSTGELHRLNSDNEKVLQILLILNESLQDSEEESDGPSQEHWRRMDAKLDLLLSLVGEMLTATVSLPDLHMLQLGVEGLCLHGIDIGSVQVGMLLKVTLFLDAKLPRPIQLFGHIRAVTKDSFTLSYCSLDARLQDLLDKHVFRQHRRAIASSRHKA